MNDKIRFRNIPDDLPKHIQGKLEELVDAHEAFLVAIENHPPEAPFAVGDKVVVRDDWTGVERHALVTEVSFEPKIPFLVGYSGRNYDGWKIKVNPHVRGWKRPTKNGSPFSVDSLRYELTKAEEVRRYE